MDGEKIVIELVQKLTILQEVLKNVADNLTKATDNDHELIDTVITKINEIIENTKKIIEKFVAIEPIKEKIDELIAFNEREKDFITRCKECRVVAQQKEELQKFITEKDKTVIDKDRYLAKLWKIIWILGGAIAAESVAIFFILKALIKF